MWVCYKCGGPSDTRWAWCERCWKKELPKILKRARVGKGRYLKQLRQGFEDERPAIPPTASSRGEGDSEGE